jgi:hypothetical protein
VVLQVFEGVNCSGASARVRQALAALSRRRPENLRGRKTEDVRFSNAFTTTGSSIGTSGVASSTTQCLQESTPRIGIASGELRMVVASVLYGKTIDICLSAPGEVPVMTS